MLHPDAINRFQRQYERNLHQAQDYGSEPARQPATIVYHDRHGYTQVELTDMRPDLTYGCIFGLKYTHAKERRDVPPSQDIASLFVHTKRGVAFCSTSNRSSDDFSFLLAPHRAVIALRIADLISGRQGLFSTAHELGHSSQFDLVRSMIDHAQGTTVNNTAFEERYAPAFDRFMQYVRKHADFWPDFERECASNRRFTNPVEASFTSEKKYGTANSLESRHPLGFMAVSAAKESDAWIQAYQLGLLGTIAYGMSPTDMQSYALQRLSTYDAYAPEPLFTQSFQYALSRTAQ